VERRHALENAYKDRAENGEIFDFGLKEIYGKM